MFNHWWYQVTVVISWETWVAQLTQWLKLHCLPLLPVRQSNELYMMIFSSPHLNLSALFRQELKYI